MERETEEEAVEKGIMCMSCGRLLSSCLHCIASHGAVYESYEKWNRRKEGRKKDGGEVAQSESRVLASGTGGWK